MKKLIERIGIDRLVISCFRIMRINFEKLKTRRNVVVEYQEQAGYLLENGVCFSRLKIEDNVQFGMLTAGTKKTKYGERDYAFMDITIGDAESYLFMDKNGERIKESIMTGRLRKYCEQLNIPYRSPHKMRKTVISKMVDAQMNINTVRKFAGHEDEKTTYNNYCFDVKRKEENRNQLEEALDRNHKYGNIIVFNRAEKPRMCCNQM